MSSVSGAHIDDLIESARGLGGRGGGVRELGVDSVTDDSSVVVVGSVSGERMGEGSGKGGGTGLTEGTGNSDGTTEGLATDSGSEIRPAILVVDTVRVVSPGELMVGESGG